MTRNDSDNNDLRVSCDDGEVLRIRGHGDISVDVMSTSAEYIWLTLAGREFFVTCRNGNPELFEMDRHGETITRDGAKHS